jgi:hypothetical protein
VNPGSVKHLLLWLDLTTYSYFHFLKGDLFPGGHQRIFGRLNQAKAAGDFHKGERDALDRVRSEDLGQLISVPLDIIKFGTTNDNRFPFQEVLMEIGVGQGDTICNNQEVSTLEEGSIDRNQF